MVLLLVLVARHPLVPGILAVQIGMSCRLGPVQQPRGQVGALPCSPLELTEAAPTPSTLAEPNRLAVLIFRTGTSRCKAGTLRSHRIQSSLLLAVCKRSI